MIGEKKENMSMAQKKKNFKIPQTQMFLKEIMEGLTKDVGVKKLFETF